MHISWYFREAVDENKSLRNSWLSMQIWRDGQIWLRSMVINSENLHIFQPFYLRHISSTASVEQQITNLQCPVKWLTDDIGRPGVPISLRTFVFRRFIKAFITTIRFNESPPTNYKIDLWKSALYLFWNCFEIFVFQVHSQNNDRLRC